MAQNRGQQGQKQPGGGVKIELITDKDAPIQDTNTQEWVKWIEIRASKGGAMMSGATARIKKGVRVVTTVFLAKGEAVYEHREPDSAQGEQIELRISLDDGSAAEEKVSFTIPKLPTAPPAPTAPGSQSGTSQTAQTTNTAPNGQPAPAPKTCKCKKTGCGEDIPDGTKFCPKCGQDQKGNKLDSVFVEFKKGHPIFSRLLGIGAFAIAVFIALFLVRGILESWWWSIPIIALGAIAYIMISDTVSYTPIIWGSIVLMIVGSLIAFLGGLWTSKHAQQQVSRAAVQVQKSDTIVYQPGEYTFRLKAGEETDHWIDFPEGRITNFEVSSSDDSNFLKIHSDGKIVGMNEYYEGRFLKLKFLCLSANCFIKLSVN